MRKFIVSDLHGNGEVYDSIMAYLGNIDDEVELYINGDLIDRGLDSFRMFEEVIEAINGKGKIKIIYLGGNHELSMYQALLERPPGRGINQHSNWIDNGGWAIEGILDMRDDFEEKCEEYKQFLSNLKIFHEFEEVINNNKLVLVHAQVPQNLDELRDLKIGHNNTAVQDAVWTRKEIRVPLIFGLGDVIGMNRIGKEDYLSIVGHTPVTDDRGFTYDHVENYFNIDGGCAMYARGHFQFDHVPLVEVKDDYLKILIFNHNNEIIDGYYFEKYLLRMSNEDLEKERLLLNHSYDNNGLENKKLIKELYER